jgi:hypothetical protein
LSFNIINLLFLYIYIYIKKDIIDLHDHKNVNLLFTFYSREVTKLRGVCSERLLTKL